MVNKLNPHYVQNTMKTNAQYLFNKYYKWYYYFVLAIPLAEFIKLVKTNGKWDLKNKIEWKLKKMIIMLLMVMEKKNLLMKI